jgi:hypothetical protein
MKQVALYLLPSALASSSSSSSLLEAIRSSDYLAEQASGEDPIEESALWDLIQPQESSQDVGKDDEEAINRITKEVVAHQSGSLAKNIVIFADSSSVTNGKMGTVLVVELNESGEKEKDRLKVAIGSLLEVAQNLALGAMTLKEVS